MTEKKNKKKKKNPLATHKVDGSLNMEQLLADSLPFCVKMFGPKGNLLFINKFGQREHSLVGWTDRQIQKWNYLECLAPKYRPQARQAMRDALTGKSSQFTVEHSHTHSQGGFCNSTVTPVKNKGKIQFILFSSQDITNRKHTEESLTNSEAKFRSIFENAIDGILIADIRTQRFTMANPAICRLLGYSQKELLTLGIKDIHPKEELPAIQAQFMRLAKGITDTTRNIPFIKKDGSIAYADITASRLTIGKQRYLVGYFRDITERKQANEALRQSEADLKEAQRIAGMGHWDLDLVRDKLHWSDEIYRIFEIDPKKFGASYEAFLRMIHPDDRKAVHRAYSHSINRKKPYEITHRILMNDGRVKYVRERGETFYNSNGKPTHSVGTVQEVTQQKSAEMALQKSEKRYRRLFEAARDGILILDYQTGKVVDANPFLTEMLAIPKTELVDKQLWELGFFRDIIQNKANFLELKRKKFIRYENLPLETAKGRRFNVEFISNVYDVGDEKVIQCNIRDITERRLAEDALLNSEKRYHDIFEASKDALMLLDEKEFLDCNQATLKMFGYKTIQEFRGKHPGQVSPPKQPNGTPSMTLANKRIREAYRKGSIQFEWMHRRRNGKDFPASVILVPFELEGKKVLQATVRDITEQKKAENELKTLSARQKSILSTVPDIIMEVDNKKVYTWANQAGYDFFGMDVIGKEAIHYFEGEQKTYEIVKPLFFGKDKVIYLESWQRRTDGQTRLLAWWCKTLKDKDGKVIGALSSAQDITDQKKAEQEILRLKDFLERVIHNSPIGIATTDINGNVTSANPAVLRILGSPSEEKTRHFNVLTLKPMVEQGLSRLFKRCLMRGKSAQSYGMPYTSYWGKLAHISLKIVPFSDSEGKRMGSIALIEDVTERKKAEEKLREIQRRLEADHTIAGMGSYSLTVATGKWESSTILDGIFGIRKNYPHTVKGWTNLIHPDDRHMMADYLANEVLGKRQRFDKEYRIIRQKDRKTCWVHGFGDLEIGKNGKPLRMIGVIMDITEQKKVEQAKMELVSMASHQLRTPPTGIKWFSTMLLEEDAGKLNPKQKSYLKEILYNNQRMIDLVHSLLNVSRIELGTLFVNTKLQRIQIPMAIDDVLAELSSQIQEKQLIVLKHYGKKLPPVQADLGFLRIILHNLIHNATLYTMDGNPITMGAKRRGSEILITIADRGLGIPKTQQARLFSKFFRAKNAIEGKIAGSGLGLYIAKTLAVAMGGKLTFKSALGKGSTFFLTVPIKSKIPSMPTNA